MILYDYPKSTAAYRVRIALRYKNINFESKIIDLKSGEQFEDNYKNINSQSRIPTLVINNNIKISQSMAILDYLENKYPQPNIYPDNIILKAKALQISNIISSDIHPLNNLGVLNYLEKSLAVNPESKLTWYHHWLKLGFDSIENLLDKNSDFCVDNKISIADICLIPQVYNANRFEFDMTPYPKIQKINSTCLKLDYFNFYI